MSIVLDNFRFESVMQGTLALFDSLGIKLVTPTNRPFNLRGMIANPSKTVLEALGKVDEAYFVGTIDDEAIHGQDDSLSLDEEINRIDEHYKGMMVFAIDVKNGIKISRSDIAVLTRTLNRMSKAAPVALITRYADKISFSICERTAYANIGRQGEKAGKVIQLRDIDYAQPHRGHIEILEMMRVGNISTFDALYAKWMEVFSSETLTKRFYQELSNWYALAIDVIRFPNDLSTTDDDQKFNHEGAIRLITRLIFVWFLKQRNLIPSEFFDPKFVGEKLLKEFDPHEPVGLFGESARKSHYYRGILQNLFFATLNCPLTKDGRKELTERQFKDGKKQYNVNNLMRYRDLFRDPDLFIRMCNTVPFLNGGLFDCLDEKGKKGMYYDGFSERKESIEQLCVPDYLFFSENIKADLSGFYDDKKLKNVTVRGLIDIFNRYQFTVEENTPLDQEVALDPELLGKVFENLLASFNPETKTTARKQTGSFYTPREIVQYMVDESLVAHLKKVVGPELEDEYRKLLSYSDDTVDLTSEQKKAIMEGLYNCKILDPACGSGAFPMGILQQMVHILKKIDPDNTQWKDMLLEIAIRETSDAYRNSSDSDRNEAINDIEKSFNAKINRPDYARKLYLIENCIYGVDIQPIAIQISKLRFFISLVIDQITNDDPADNFGIRPLPNLEAKFVAANSLRSISKAKSLGDTDTVKELKEELKRLNHKIFGAKSWSKKKRLQAKLSETRQKLADELASIGMYSQSESMALASWDMFDQNRHADFFDPEWMFGIKDGFDIVIGNPPYVVVTRDVYPEYEWNLDLYKIFFERGIKYFLNKIGTLCYITPKFFLVNYDDMNMRSYLIEKLHIKSFTLCNPFDVVTENVISLIEFGKNGCYIPVYKHSPKDNEFLRIEDLNLEYSLTNLYKEMVLGVSPEIISLLEKIKGSHRQLGEISDSKRGAEVSKNYLRNSDNGAKALIGKDMKKYVINWDNTYFPENHKEFLRLKDFFHQNLIYLRRVDTCLEATISLEGYYAFNKNIYGIKINSANYSIPYVLALLNSKVLDFYYKQRFSTKKTEAFPEIQPYLYKQLPIPVASKIVQAELSSLVNDILVSKKELVEFDSSSLEDQIDFIVYKLFGLSFENILMIDPETNIDKKVFDKIKV